ncbi:MAG: putative hydroxymethylpyrimidine transporter CytX [Oscillospiraceae bacterium]|jgi:putative hydroxymethylpyrimidine transporter CytX|nr:putative hydroxymethylpyrimidine transporter CytX [Oscillospiraceae bacterium]
MKKSSMLLLWIGASVSISEIVTGGLLAPLGLVKGAAAVIVGHLIGTLLLAFGGYVSFSRGQNAMATVTWSMGKGGGAVVALCNVVQLVGWTIVMIVQAGSALTAIVPAFPFKPVALILSVLVVLWALILGSPARRLNDVVVIALSVMCIVLFVEVFRGAAGDIIGLHSDMSMMLAIELSIAMPVSWLPLIGDYTRGAGSRTCAATMPFIGYFCGSVLMYLLGLVIAVFSGGDFFAFIASSRFRLPACAVVILSTLTTAFLDLYSAAVSSKQIIRTRSPRMPVLVMGVFAALAAVLFPVERYGDFLTGFLGVIGMVFVPVYTVLFLDFLMKKPVAQSRFNWRNLGVAAIGMVGYRFFSMYDILIPTVMSILLVSVFYFLLNYKRAEAIK